MNKILVIRLSSIGDIIHCLPTLYALRQKFPESHISWVVNEQYADLLKLNPLLNEVILFPYKHLKQFIKEGNIIAVLKLFQKFGNELKSRNFDLCLDLHGMAKSAIIAYLSNAKKKLGIPKMRELSFLISSPVKSGSPKTHLVDQYLQTIKYLGGNINNPKFVLPITEDEKNYAKQFISSTLWGEEKGEGIIANEKFRLVGIIPGAGIPQKQWSGQNYVQLIKFLIDKDFKIIVFGSPVEENLVTKIISSVPSKSVLKVTNHDLRQLIALIDQCDLVIGGDTGPLHIAAALGKKIVALYGPNDPALTGPYTTDTNAKIIYKKLDCSPCGIKPKCVDNRCMQLITVDEVLTAV